MTLPPARGACPRLAEPMETGDGLLARIVPIKPISIDDFAAMCAAARTYGNGLMEVSARGSLQVRGLTPASATPFAAAVDALDIDYMEDVPVLASPLPDAATGWDGAQGLAARIRTAIATRKFVLAPKVSVAIDDGGPISLDALAADIRLRAITQDGKWSLCASVGGDGATAAPLGLAKPDDAAHVVAALLEVIAARGRTARARDVLALDGITPFVTAVGGKLDPAPPCPALRTTGAIGLHRLQDGRCAFGVSLPFGQTHALDLVALLRIARANGATWAAPAPHRTLLLGPIGEMAAFALGTAADSLRFIVDARDARRRVVACAGAPACTSGLIAARAVAADIAGQLSQGDFAVHVSGCAKGCAHPSRAPLTIVGTEHGAGFVESGTARATLKDYPDENDVVAEAVRAVAREGTNA